MAFTLRKKSWLFAGKKARPEETTEPPTPHPRPHPRKSNGRSINKNPTKAREDHSNWYNGMFAGNGDTNPYSLCLNRCALKLDQLAKPTFRSRYHTIFGHGTEEGPMNTVASTLKHGTPRLNLLRVPFLTQHFHSKTELKLS